MTTPSPVDVLMDEHQIILRVLTAMEARLASLGQGPFPSDFFQGALDFFRNFADGCHHYKEEDALFPAMIRRGVATQGGPIGCMLKEHEFGRNCLGVVRSSLDAAAAGDAAAASRLAEAATAYIQMLREHIYKEDHILFRMARQVLTPEDVAALTADFSNQDNPKITAEVRRRYETLADELCQTPVTAA